jgi:ATP-dependent Clp protease adaptor protein ClpS
MAEEPKDAIIESTGSGTQTLIKPDPETKEPKLYKVVILNDDFTPREFVVHILVRFFAKSEPEATQLMLRVHNQGSGVAGTYSHELAETKTFQVNAYSKQNQFPLKAVMEEA